MFKLKNMSPFQHLELAVDIIEQRFSKEDHLTLYNIKKELQKMGYNAYNIFMRPQSANLYKEILNNENLYNSVLDVYTKLKVRGINFTELGNIFTMSVIEANLSVAELFAIEEREETSVYLSNKVEDNNNILTLLGLILITNVSKGD